MANTLKFGNGNWATKEGSTLAYNDENNNFKPLPFNFTRASTATYVDSDGLIKTSKQGEARIDYTDSSDGVLLLENSSTNLITYSEDFTQWSNTRSSDLSGFISPNGENNATKFISDTTASSSHIIKSTDFTISSGQKYTYSVFVKANQLNYVRLMFTDSAVSKYLSVFFNLTNGTVGTTFDGSTATLDFSNIENFGNGWFRCSVSGDLDTTTTAHARIYLADNDNSFSFNGDGTSGIYVWGAMLEQNSIASSYIPSNGSAVTRIAETCSNSGNSEVFNDSEGVLFVNAAALANDGTNRFIAISDGSNDDRVQIIYSSTDDTINSSVLFGNTSQCSFSEGNITTTNFNKIALKYKADDFSFWINGMELDTDTSGSAPSGLNVFEFERPTDVSQFYGKIKEVKIYNTALTDLELETLTSYTSWVSMVNELNLNIIYNG